MNRDAHRLRLEGHLQRRAGGGDVDGLLAGDEADLLGPHGVGPEEEADLAHGAAVVAVDLDAGPLGLDAQAQGRGQLLGADDVVDGLEDRLLDAGLVAVVAANPLALQFGVAADALGDGIVDGDGAGQVVGAHLGGDVDELGGAELVGDRHAAVLPAAAAQGGLPGEHRLDLGRVDDLVNPAGGLAGGGLDGGAQGRGDSLAALDADGDLGAVARRSLGGGGRGGGGGLGELGVRLRLVAVVVSVLAPCRPRHRTECKGANKHDAGV